MACCILAAIIISYLLVPIRSVKRYIAQLRGLEVANQEPENASNWRPD